MPSSKLMTTPRLLPLLAHQPDAALQAVSERLLLLEFLLMVLVNGKQRERDVAVIMNFYRLLALPKAEMQLLQYSLPLSKFRQPPPPGEGYCYDVRLKVNFVVNWQRDMSKMRCLHPLSHEYHERTDVRWMRYQRSCPYYRILARGISNDPMQLAAENAAFSNDLVFVSEWLAQARPNLENLTSVIAMAIVNSNVEVLKYLLLATKTTKWLCRDGSQCWDAPVKLTFPFVDYASQKPISIAAAVNFTRGVELLLKYGCDPGYTNSLLPQYVVLVSPLIHSVRRRNVDLTRLLMEHDFEINEAWDYSSGSRCRREHFEVNASTAANPLLIAVCNEDVPMVRLLLDAGADPTFSDPEYYELGDTHASAWEVLVDYLRPDGVPDPQHATEALTQIESLFHEYGFPPPEEPVTILRESSFDEGMYRYDSYYDFYMDDYAADEYTEVMEEYRAGRRLNGSWPKVE